MNIEKEYKMLLNEKQFNNLLNCFSFNTNTQINHYFQANNNKDIAIRIREINNTYIFTMKIKKDVLYELEFNIPNNDINDPKIKKVFLEYNLDDVIYLGKLKTIRHTYNDTYGQICLDYNEYNNLIDYEIEYELYDHNLDYLNYFKELLKTNNIIYKENNISKIKRFKNTIIQ